MTVQRRDSNDSPFSDWLRSHKELDSVRHSLYVSDLDMTFFKYRTHVDKIGTRDVKLMMDVEVKTHDASPSKDQIEALFFRHQLLRNIGEKAKERRCQLWSTRVEKIVALWHFGQFILKLCGADRPEMCRVIQWLQFGNNGHLVSATITEKELVGILDFAVRPDTLKPLELRRHHLTQELVTVERRGLLFPRYRSMFKRS